MCWLIPQGKIAAHADSGMAERRPLRTTSCRGRDRPRLGGPIRYPAPVGKALLSCPGSPVSTPANHGGPHSPGPVGDHHVPTHRGCRARPTPESFGNRPECHDRALLDDLHWKRHGGHDAACRPQLPSRGLHPRGRALRPGLRARPLPRRDSDRGSGPHDAAQLVPRHKPGDGGAFLGHHRLGDVVTGI